MANLHTITVKGHFPKHFHDFKQDVEIALIDTGTMDSVEAELLMAQKDKAMRKQFQHMTMVIEYSPIQFDQAISKFIKTIQ